MITWKCYPTSSERTHKIDGNGRRASLDFLTDNIMTLGWNWRQNWVFTPKGPFSNSVSLAYLSSFPLQSALKDTATGSPVSFSVKHCRKLSIFHQSLLDSSITQVMSKGGKSAQEVPLIKSEVIGSWNQRHRASSPQEQWLIALFTLQRTAFLWYSRFSVLYWKRVIGE